MVVVHLNANRRHILIMCARRAITSNVHEAYNLKRANKEFDKEFKAAFLATFPQKHMRILAKYNLAHKNRNVQVTSPGGTCFSRVAPPHLLVPSSNYSCPIVPMEPSITVPYNKLRKAIDKEIAMALRSFRSLINTSKTLEQVIKAWPEAEELRGQVAPKTLLPSCLTKSDLEIITKFGAAKKK